MASKSGHDSNVRNRLAYKSAAKRRDGVESTELRMHADGKMERGEGPCYSMSTTPPAGGSTTTAGLASMATAKHRVGGILDGTRPKVAQISKKDLGSKARKDDTLRFPLQTPIASQRQKSKEKLNQRKVVSTKIKGARPNRNATSARGQPTTVSTKATTGARKASLSTRPVTENSRARSQKVIIASAYRTQVGGHTKKATARTPFERRTQAETGAQLPIEKTRTDQIHPKREKMHGTIVTVRRNAAYIKSFDSLPPDYNRDRDVSFPANKAMSGYMAIREGDEVDFTLGTKDKNRPTAFNVRLVRATRRSVHSWQIYFKILKSILVSGDVTNLGQLGDFCSPRYADSIEDIIVNILACAPVWEEVGRCKDLGNKEVNLILGTLLELYKRTWIMGVNFDRILRIIVSSNLFCSHSGPVSTFIVDAFKQGSKDEDLSLIRRFLLVVVKCIPEKARFVVTLIKPMLMRGNVSKATVSFLRDLLKQAAAFLSDSIYDMAWEEVPVVPPMKELLSGPLESNIHLQRVKTSGSYASYEEYMDTYFRLLRADCHDALKTGIHNLLRGNLDHRDMNVYRNIELQGIRLSFRGSSLVIKLAPETSKRLTQHGRLMVGNLLCITIDGSFRDAIWATVSNIDLLKTEKIVLIDLSTDSNTLCDGGVVMALKMAGTRPMMVESPTYFKAYQPVLKALQSMHPLADNFKDVLVKVQAPSHPEYVNIDAEISVPNTTRGWAYASDEELSQGSENSYGDQSQSTENSDFNQSQSRVNVLEYARSPSMIMPDTLDESQEAAVKHALSHSVALIEGPPGTGKTYIGVKLVELILSMTTKPSTPILVLTYKNHALDEFLKEVLPVTLRLIRVGGRSQEPLLEHYSLNSVREKNRMPVSLYQQFRSYCEQKDEQQRHVKKHLQCFQRSLRFSVRSFVDYLTTDALKLFLETCDWKKTNVKPFQTKGQGKEGYIPVKSKRKKIAKTEVVDFLSQLPLGDGDEFLDQYQRHQLSILLNAALNLWLPAEKVFQQLDTNSEILVQQNSRTDTFTEAVETSDNEEEERKIAEEEKSNLIEGSGERDKKDIEKLKGEIHFFKGKTKPPSTKFVPELSNLVRDLESEVRGPVQVENLWGLSQESRARLVLQMIQKSSHRTSRELKEALADYRRICTMKNEIEEQHKANLLKDAQIIGMTITGASIYHHYLEQVRPAVVIVEEAAEVLEPQLLAVLGDWVQHLILIGDHKQLRPPVETYTLARDYSFDVSMMERLILNNLPHTTLAMQNRMRPEFAELLLDIYPHLKSNLSRVENNKPSECIEQSMFFWDHTDPETADRSYTNEDEADRSVRLALFLIQHGYTPTTITILAAYRGQTALVRRKIREAQTEYPELFLDQDENAVTKFKTNDEEFKTIKSYTIDMYQGDENDFLIVSLVRSNPQKKIGFLKVLNRRCVAQSRARRGMYFIGNKEVLMVDHHWRVLINKLQEKECVSSILPLQCPKHPTLSKQKAESASDISLQVFCKLGCPEFMLCGKHKCPAYCQPSHNHKKCTMNVPFVHDICGHSDTRACWQREGDIGCMKDCPELMWCGKHPCSNKCHPRHSHYRCTEKVEFMHETCGHSDRKQCYEDESMQECRQRVSMVFRMCGHPGKKRCYQNDSDLDCRSLCSKVLPCGHGCTLSCAQPCKPKDCPHCARIREMEARKVEAKRRELHQKDIERKLKQLGKARTVSPTFTNITSVGEGASEYIDMEDRAKNYLQSGCNWFPNITRIEKVVNIKLEKRWLHAKLKMHDANMHSELKFYCTSGIPGITRTGFRMPTSPDIYGLGIYFASHSPNNAQVYDTKGWNQLLVCDVLLGKSKSIERQMREMTWEMLNHEEYDSVFAKRAMRIPFDEFVIYRPEQALPRYIIHYEKMTIEAPELLPRNRVQRNAMSAGRLQHFTIEPKRQIDLNDPLDIHFRVAESQFLRLMTRSHVLYAIKKVDYYVNPSLLVRFEAKQREFQKEYGRGVESQSVLAFPRDPVESHIDKIVRENFGRDLSRRTVHGSGICFSEFPNIGVDGMAIGKLLLCRILPGRCSNESPRREYDSYRVRRNQRDPGQMLVIGDPDQILPCYIIHYVRR